jgi:hypothetical protein
VSDVTAWCLLAFVVGVVQSRASSALAVAVLTLAFIAVVFVVIRPLAVRWTRRFETRDPDRGAIALALVAALVTALVTEAIGVHAIFGAFLAGAIIPHDSRLARTLDASLVHLVTILLLPAFFAFTGMRTEIGLIAGWGNWLVCGLIVAVATAPPPRRLERRCAAAYPRSAPVVFVVRSVVDGTRPWLNTCVNSVANEMASADAATCHTRRPERLRARSQPRGRYSTVFRAMSPARTPCSNGTQRMRSQWGCARKLRPGTTATTTNVSQSPRSTRFSVSLFIVRDRVYPTGGSCPTAEPVQP